MRKIDYRRIANIQSLPYISTSLLSMVGLFAKTCGTDVGIRAQDLFENGYINRYQMIKCGRNGKSCFPKPSTYQLKANYGHQLQFYLPPIGNGLLLLIKHPLLK